MNTQLPKFTFFLPVYNEEKRIVNCINSILNQDYPQDNIEILVIDGGSIDKTKELASKYACVRIFDNPLKLADFGAKISAKEATGDLFVIFAADNELVGKDWLMTTALIFKKEPKNFALWGKMISSKQDPPLNRYYTLIQNDPLSFFINKNLKYYLKKSEVELISGKKVYLFNVNPEKPLIWGANGLVYRTDIIKKIILQDSFLADNDVFQIMLERGFIRVAYIPEPYIYHHHVKQIKEWVKKWKRNYVYHFLSKIEQRNLRWVFDKNFNKKLLAWIIYSGLPVFSVSHSIYLSFKDKTRYWLYHPIMNFVQMGTYLVLTIFTKEGRIFLKARLLR
ncbi:MAG: hypothetical protein A2166_02790 [Omnitrophica WOR_2 bacterium RBG_13_41_10]|nr:MAG: hypothetical protein A2166_02790 [Omnitrophica WOR_2 bacterium RBG_13_41_10]